MRISISSTLQSDIYAATTAALAQCGIVNVPVVADQIRARNWHENVALEDIERSVLEAAQLFRAPIEFDRGQADQADFLPDVGAIVTIVAE